jgi:hypothetical protein
MAMSKAEVSRTAPSASGTTRHPSPRHQHRKAESGSVAASKPNRSKGPNGAAVTAPAAISASSVSPRGQRDQDDAHARECYPPDAVIYWRLRHR